MPAGWNHFKLDARNIRAIHKRFGSGRIDTHPLVGTLDYLAFKYIWKIEWVSILDFVDYNKEQAIDLLVREYGYKPYPYKHYESVFTRFYQGYILPQRFGVDKRKVHFSTLIMSGQLSRDDAIHDLGQPAYDEQQLIRDRQFVLKKLGKDESWFSDYLNAPIHAHLDYPSELPRWQSWLSAWTGLKQLIRARL